MNDEIKEILYLENYINKYKSDEKSIINGNRLTTPAMLDYLEVKALLDYITNLQIKNKELEQIIDIRECQLEEMEINKTDYTQVNILEMQLEDYKTRNNKAIEYIKWNLDKNEELIEYFNYDANFNELLNILRGEE